MYLQVKLMKIPIFFFGLGNSKSYSSHCKKMLVPVIPVGIQTTFSTIYTHRYTIHNYYVPNTEKGKKILLLYLFEAE